MSVVYDNRSYWINPHEKFKGELRAVGHPVLTMLFSKADTLDFQTFRGNGIPRHLYYRDDLLAGFGLRRFLVFPAVSFLLNENIEAPDKVSYLMAMWKLLCKLDRIDHFAEKVTVC